MSPPVGTSRQLSSQTPSSISSSLLERIRAGDQEAWHRLVGIFGPLVYRWAREFGVQAADTGDIVQEVFRAVSLNVGRFRRDCADDSFRGWLWIIARNKVHDYFRARRGQPRRWEAPTRRNSSSRCRSSFPRSLIRCPAGAKPASWPLVLWT